MRKKLQKIIACITIFSMVFCIAPEYQVRADVPEVQVLDASDLTIGTIDSTITNNQFTINANTSQSVTIDMSEQMSDDYRNFTQVIKLNGTGTNEYRSICFTTEGAASISVVALSGSGSADGTLGIYDASGEEVTTIDVYGTAHITDSDKKIPVATASVSAAGAYTIYSKGSGINIYYISIVEGEQTPITFNDGKKPSVISAVQDENDEYFLDVTVEGTIPDAATDRLWVKLYDESDNLVDSEIVKSLDTNNQALVQLQSGSNGNFTVVCEAVRNGCTTSYKSDIYSYISASLPLGDVEITSIKTTKDQELEVKWNAVTNAESYSIFCKQKDASDFTALASGLTDTSYTIPSDNLTVGETYTIKVEAMNTETTRFATMNKTVSAIEGRFIGGLIGSGASGTITEHVDGSVTLDATKNGNGGKLADSEDGFLYYYTEIDPENENFIIQADCYVEKSSEKENMSGFGIMAVDTLEAGNSSARYFNSAGSMVRKYYGIVDGNMVNLYGAPGGYFVTGYTDKPTEYSNSRTLIDTAPFDWNWKSDYVTDTNPNLPKFEDGETYTLILKKDNTGFKASMIDSTTGEETDEIICYKPDLLLQQDRDKYYVGFAVARKIIVKISNIKFSTSDPTTDAPGIERPKTEVTATFSFDSTSKTSNSSYEAAFKANYKGAIKIIDSNSRTVAEDVIIDPGNATFRATANLNLVEGDNTFKAIFTPDSDQGSLLGSTETLNQTPIEMNLTITYKKYGTSDNAIYVSANGNSTNIGTKARPLDIYTAVAYAQPGQEIVLLEGTYHLTKKLEIERGNNGTASSPITIMSEPGTRVKINLANSSSGGFIINGDYWHIYNFEIYNGQANQRVVQVGGNNNIVEKVTVHDNGYTGIQISGNAQEPFALWPSNNLVLSCESYNNCDPQNTDADGFAARLTVGEGNVFRYCISHHNINDGWDLYAKSTTGVIGEVLIEQCVAYENGHLTLDSGNTKNGEGNGFKLGGEGIPVAHRLKNSISFNNDANGVFSNTNPSVKVENITSYYNGGRNLYLNTNALTTTWGVSNFISYGNAGSTDSMDLKNQSSLLGATNYIDGKNTNEEKVTDSWFESLDTSLYPTIAEDGSIDMHCLLILTRAAQDGVGAVISANPNPTVIGIGTEISVPVPDPAPGPAPDYGSTPTLVSTPTPVPTEVPTPEPVKEKEELEVKDGTLISCDIAKDGTVTIPDSIAKTITQISADTFRNNESITSVDLSNTNIETISRLAFENCESLKEITLPSTVEKIDASAFRNCSSLETIKLPASLKTISMYAFTNCSNLSSVTLERGFNGVINATAFSKTDITIYGYARTKKQIKAGVKAAKSFADSLGVPFVYIKMSAVTKPVVTQKGGVLAAQSKDTTVSYYQLWKWDDETNKYKYETSKTSGNFKVGTGSYRIVAMRKYGNGMIFRSKSSDTVAVK